MKFPSTRIEFLHEDISFKSFVDVILNNSSKN
jgi:hypothetical protein